MVDYSEMTSREMEEQWLQSQQPTLEERLLSQEVELVILADRMEQMMQRIRDLESHVEVLESRLDYHTDRHYQWP